jgi:putative ABC transport system substrate-binding protein
MKRREFIAGLGGAVAWPAVVRAQQPVMPVVGFVHYASADTTARSVASFREGLREVGFLEGQNVAIEYRWAEGQYDRLPDILKELIDQRVAVIVTGGGSSVALAAKNATSAIPIVFVVGVDPVRAGLAASLSRPGGNLTFFAGEMTVKLIELIDQLVPKSAPLERGIFRHPSSPFDHFGKAGFDLLSLPAGTTTSWRASARVAVRALASSSST